MKKKARFSRSATQGPRRTTKVLICGALCLSVAAVVFAQWRPLSSTIGLRAVPSVSAPVPSPTVPPQSSPSKEYIYAGGRLIATEEPIAPTNLPPTVNIASPATGSAFNSNAQINVTATDTDGTISQVQIYEGATLLGQAAFGGGTYNYSWNNVAVGTHLVNAKATDDDGATTISPIISIRSNAAPTSSITSPASGSAFNANVQVKVTAADTDGTISQVQIYEGPTLLGQATFGGGTYNYNWNNVTVGPHTLTAIATDNDGATKTSVAIGVRSNAAPTSSITSPASGSAFNANVQIKVTAADTDGTISQVQIYEGPTLLGQATFGAGTYNYNWNNVAVGPHTLTAIATDNDGATKTSVAISVRSNTAPTSSITSPASGSAFNSNVQIKVTAADTDGTISQVQIFEGPTLLGQATFGAGTYNYNWNNVAVGPHTLTAIATDNDGATKTSVAISVRSNTAPTSSITSPASGSAFNSNVQMKVTAADTDGTISQVQIYEGPTLLGQATFGAGTYNYNWNNVAVGTHSVTAIATDNDGATKTSVAISLISNAAPTVSITGPANNSMFTPLANIVINASAGDSDGTVTQVEFYEGTTLIGTDTGIPFTITWSNVVSGAYSLTARATDNRGATTTSTAVSVTTPTFSDDFNDNSIDSGKWSIADPGSPMVATEQEQQLRVTLAPSTFAYNYLISNATHDIRGGSVQVDVPQPASLAGWVETFLYVTLNDQNRFLINTGAGSILFRSTINGVNDQTVLPADPITHRHWRIRHDSTSNTVSFDTSSDGTSWVIRKTVTAGFSLTAVKFWIGAGAWGTGNSNPGAAKFDNFQFIARATSFPTCTPPTGVVISEFRLRGASGASDEFVELYNNTDQSLTICTPDGTGGWAVASSDGTVRFVVPYGTIIPARGHYLAVGSSYSLTGYAAYDQAYSSEAPDNLGIALFNSATPANFIISNRLDAAGFTTDANAVYREGTGLTSIGTSNGPFSFVRKLAGNTPQDTANNAADFAFVSTDGGTYGVVVAVLGAPSPENLASPILGNATLVLSLIDPAVASTAAPNRVRDTAAIGPNAALGTLTTRRKITNNTGSPVTRLRFRVIDITTLNMPGYVLGGRSRTCEC